MIGAPTNFQHTGHIGSGSFQAGPGEALVSAKSQMGGKGGHLDRGEGEAETSLVSTAVPIVKQDKEGAEEAESANAAAGADAAVGP